MTDWENETQNRRPRAASGKQALVVRQAGEPEDDPLQDILERIKRLETAPKAQGKGSDRDPAPAPRFELKTIVAIAAILLSLTGYMIEDARNTSRHDAEIEATTMRVTNLEKIANANTEARIRTEVQLGELREGQQEIKDMLRTHDNLTLKALREK